CWSISSTEKIEPKKKHSRPEPQEKPPEMRAFLVYIVWPELSLRDQPDFPTTLFSRVLQFFTLHRVMVN
ncbi:MAG TPA: hypothetical protein VK826_08810, partial [Bacteroidia bacterium]|nr:hypothetical protein [Bacteroidia bacterium]